MDYSAAEPYSLICDPLNLTGEFVGEWLSPSDFITAHTSGSTGTPKEIRLLKSDMIHSAEATCRFFGIASGDVLYLPLSADYIAGKMMIVRALVAGARLIADKPSNSPDGCRSNSVALAAIVPSQIEGFLQNTPRGNCRSLIVGGSAIQPLQRQMLAERTDIAVYATYGMTETCSHVALCWLSGNSTADTFKALPGITFSLDSRGCLVIGAPDYSFRQITTNDTARLLSPTEFILTGRIDNVINSGGLKIHPEEIEKAIGHLIAQPFYVTWRPSAKWGKEAVLIIENGNAPVPSDEARLGLLQQIRAVLPHSKCPKEIYFQAEFSRTASGKIIRNHR